MPGGGAPAPAFSMRPVGSCTWFISMMCVPLRSGAPAYSYGYSDYYYAAPDWYRPWVFEGGIWAYRPYPYHDWYYRTYRGPSRGYYGRPYGGRSDGYRGGGEHGGERGGDHGGEHRH